jgi:hypothetical protein
MIKFRVLPALAAAAVSLTACGTHTTAASTTASAAPATPASCHQQYKAWKTGGPDRTPTPGAPDAALR